MNAEAITLTLLATRDTNDLALVRIAKVTAWRPVRKLSCKSPNVEAYSAPLIKIIPFLYVNA